MGQKKMQIEEKARTLTLLEKGESVIAVAEDVGVARKANYQLKRRSSGHFNFCNNFYNISKL